MLVESVSSGKRVARLQFEKYQPIRAAILMVLPTTGAGLSWKELVDKVALHLPTNLFPDLGAIYWYVKTVQLDLEAKGLIERVPDARPLRLRRKSLTA